jgi:hypothetical protein
MNTNTATIVPATAVVVGDRVTNLSGSIVTIDRHEDGIVFGTTFGAVFARRNGESVSVLR